MAPLAIEQVTCHGLGSRNLRRAQEKPRRIPQLGEYFAPPTRSSRQPEDERRECYARPCTRGAGGREWVTERHGIYRRDVSRAAARWAP